MCRTRAKTIPIQAPIRTTNPKPIRVRSVRRLRLGLYPTSCKRCICWTIRLARPKKARCAERRRRQPAAVFKKQVNREKEKARRPRPPGRKESCPPHRLADRPGRHRGGFRAGDGQVSTSHRGQPGGIAAGQVDMRGVVHLRRCGRGLCQAKVAPLAFTYSA